jgi:hypothetical protein
MTTTMAKPGLIVSGGAVHADKETKPLGNYWKALLPRERYYCCCRFRRG